MRMRKYQAHGHYPRMRRRPRHGCSCQWLRMRDAQVRNPAAAWMSSHADGINVYDCESPARVDSIAISHEWRMHILRMR